MDPLSVSVSFDLFFCSHCGNSFLSAVDLKEHIKTHNAHLVYACNFCDKRFGCKYNLRAHMRMHTVKSNECPHCFKRFTRSSGMDRHVKSLHDSLSISGGEEFVDK